MSEELPLSKRFHVLCQITRAQHFAWREAVQKTCPGVDAVEVVKRMWEVTGEQTGRSYAQRIDPGRPVAPQVAESICWSSRCMGEDAVVEPGAHAGEALVRHRDCPWFHWHERLDLLAEDRPGCDAWLASSISAVNRELGTKVRFETIESLPEGGAACVRRLWSEE